MKYVTIIDIAKELGISKSTVSRALQGDDRNVNKETQKKIFELAERMGYKRNELAVNLRKQSTRTIGIVVPEMVTPFYMNFITFAQRQLNKHGYRVTLAQSHEDPEAERTNLQMLEDYRVEGILISVCHNRKNLDAYQKLMDKGIPLVFFDRTVAELSAPQVKINDYIKAFFITEHLIRNGKKHIIHLAGPSYIQNALERQEGYKAALEKFHLPCTPEQVIATGVGFADGEKAVEELIGKGVSFDAIFSFTEMSALGAKSCLQQHGLSIPGDVAIACISGTALCLMVHPSVTTVEQPVELMAETSTRLLIEKLENPSIPDETVVLSAEMIIRDSSKVITGLLPD
jgi:DNA-binding LacI/PurR family transcriptional regulator